MDVFSILGKRLTEVYKEYETKIDISNMLTLITVRKLMIISIISWRKKELLLNSSMKKLTFLEATGIKRNWTSLPVNHS